MRISIALALLSLAACEGGTINHQSEGGADTSLADSGTLDDSTPILDSGADAYPPDSGLDVFDAGVTCALDPCDCAWLASSCANYTPVLACGVSAACAQAYDVDPVTCVRTVHTDMTDAGVCILRDDRVTWCCP
jgi:hypothetical protein